MTKQKHDDPFQDLLSAGFSADLKDVAPSLVVSIDGPERSGKSTLALSGPDAVAVIAVDVGADLIIRKAKAAGKVVIPYTGIEVPSISGFSSKKKGEDLYEEIRVDCQEQLEQFKTAYFAALAHPKVKTIVWDTATEMWELVRLAYFGKLTQVQSHHYGPVNGEFRRLIKAAHKAHKNLMLVHKVKPQYVDNKRTNKLERAGFSTVGYEVDLVVRTAFDPDTKEFSLTVENCRQNPDLTGMQLAGEMCTFPILASMLFEETSQEDWA
uniref:Putative ATPase domain containing protein n=1 Tax=viral metagenome TaxID=1070528 RepID=A0A6M3KYA8_9ZZZZ